MSEMRIGSLCSGYGGLDMAVRQVLGGTVAWHSEIDPHASSVLAHHWPDVPNLGDLAAVDFEHVEPVDIVTAGFPCQDLSLAGRRAGIADGTRSGLWRHVARAAKTLRPRLVVIENVRGILSAKAHSDVELCPWCVGDGSDQPALRAFGAVLGDLADLGFDAEWAGVRAAEIGAPHERFREFALAWPADAQGSGLERSGLPRSTAQRSGAAADAGRCGQGAGTGLRTGDQDRGRGRRSRDEGGPAVADTEDERRREGQPESEVREWNTDPGGRGGAVAAHPDGRRLPGLAPSHGAEPAQHVVDADGCDVQWGPFGPAVDRWARRTRPAPRPTDDRGRLAPLFVEWLMGVPASHVTGVPGLSRTAQLKALGNGVVPAQAAAALRLLLDRANSAHDATA